MAKFKVGDKVVANAKAGERYCVTVPGTEWYVIEDPVPDTKLKYGKDADLMVAQEKDCFLGYRVRSECFDLVCCNEYEPERILVSGNRTHVFWKDGTKTTVRWNKDNGEPYSVYSAFCSALAIKQFGTNSKLKRIIDRKTEKQASRLDVEKKDGFKAEKLEDIFGDIKVD